jgi:hypothetical protein
MARPPRDPRAPLDRPGQRPILQGHLRPGGRREGDPTDVPAGTQSEAEKGTPEASAEPEAKGTPEASAQPAAEGTQGAADAARGKATRSPDAVATRPHLEGSEQGPS